ncbi:MAG: LacI family transcriptional regulator [Propionibacteriaceae bacterium]|nr:LacI family transcriptional regulator [Propionibacteriaceae bacterium]
MAEAIRTLDDVARAAGVSRATASRALNGGRNVSPRAMAAVMRVVQEHGYQPNPAARSLVTRHIGAIAVIVPEADELVFSDPFFPQAYHGALTAFKDSDYQVTLVMAEPQDSGRIVRYLESGLVDGAIVVSHHGQELASALAKASRPLTFVGSPGIVDAPFVELDQVSAARTATEYLIGKGARRIAHIAGPLDMNAGAGRQAGFEAAMDDAGLAPVGIEPGGFTIRGGQAAAERLLDAEPDLDAIFVASDLMAAGAVRTLGKRGRRIPADVMVVGFDNSPVAVQTLPALTSMTNPPAVMAEAAAKMLLSLLSGDGPEWPVIIQSELVVRGSA